MKKYWSKTTMVPTCPKCKTVVPEDNLARLLDHLITELPNRRKVAKWICISCVHTIHFTKRNPTDKNKNPFCTGKAACLYCGKLKCTVCEKSVWKMDNDCASAKTVN